MAHLQDRGEGDNMGYQMSGTYPPSKGSIPPGMIISNLNTLPHIEAFKAWRNPFSLKCQHFGGVWTGLHFADQAFHQLNVNSLLVMTESKD